LSQRDQVLDNSEESGSKDAGTESKYNDSDNDDDAADSNDNNSVMLPRWPRKEAQVDKIKDARELFS
jgi:hypothetical protein